MKRKFNMLLLVEVIVLALLLLLAVSLYYRVTDNHEDTIGALQTTTPTTKPDGPDTNPSVPSSEPSEPTTPPAQTEPTTPPSEPVQEPDSTMNYEDYIKLSAKEQKAYRESFENLAAFFTWYNAEKKEYEEQQSKVNIGDGTIDLEDIMGGSK